MGANATSNSFRAPNNLAEKAPGAATLATPGACPYSSAMSSIDMETVCLVGTHSTFMNRAATLMGM